MTKYLNAKHGIEILHADGVTQILTGTGDPSVDGQIASIGSIFMRSDNGGGLYNKTGAGDLDWLLVFGQTTAITSSGITSEQHVALHNGNKYIELIRNSNKVVSSEEWLDDTKTYHISTTTINRINNKVSSTVKEIYDYETGTNVVATVVCTINRTNNKVSSVSYLRDNSIGGF